MRHEKAERQALERLLLPTVTETRKDLELHVSFLTDRLEALKACAAGEPGGISTDAAMEAFDAVADGLRSLVSFAATTVESLRIVFEADAAKDARDAAALSERLKTADAMDLFRALDERLGRLEQLLAPALAGTREDRRHRGVTAKDSPCRPRIRPRYLNCCRVHHAGSDTGKRCHWQRLSSRASLVTRTRPVDCVAVTATSARAVLTKP